MNYQRTFTLDPDSWRSLLLLNELIRRICSSGFRTAHFLNNNVQTYLLLHKFSVFQELNNTLKRIRKTIIGKNTIILIHITMDLFPTLAEVSSRESMVVSIELIHSLPLSRPYDPISKNAFTTYFSQDRMQNSFP